MTTRPPPRPDAHDFTLMLMTRDGGVARAAVRAGVDRIFLDLEIAGKAERQRGRNTIISGHTLADLERVRAAVPDAEVLARVNPPSAGTPGEVDAVVRAGADVVMLPYFQSSQQVAAFVAAVALDGSRVHARAAGRRRPRRARVTHPRRRARDPLRFRRRSAARCTASRAPARRPPRARAPRLADDHPLAYVHRRRHERGRARGTGRSPRRDREDPAGRRGGAGPHGGRDGARPAADTRADLASRRPGRRTRVKRALDLVLGAAALVVAAPIIAVCAMAVKLGSPGPAFYAADRIGRGERTFRQYKLRTMRVGADAAGFRTATGDPRITPIGRFLRATSLDELPQLWNVLRGDMGLVGPRPAAPAQLGDYTAEQRRIRASVRPGITGLAQVSGRSSLGNEDSVAFDLWYATHASVGTDLRILVRTAGAVLGRKGTN
ncbi:MAG: hypothetical protein E6H88_06155 [Chloroflexi bacterium]|nr:MAG: hypothetical protein E6H88_06155 [Chloroflexota bacterium]